jgi:hypothetical protein
MAASDNLSGGQFKQMQFDGMPAAETPHPGTQSLSSWASRDDLVYHGTFRGEQPAPRAGMHVGTQNSAGYRVDVLADHAPRHGAGDTARVYPYRLAADSLPLNLSEHTAKAVGARFNDGDTSWVDFAAEPDTYGRLSDLSRLDPSARVAVETFQSGETIPYRNSVEDQGSTSFVIGDQSHLRTWADDVAEAKSLGLSVNPAHERAIEGGFVPTANIQHEGRNTGVMGVNENPRLQSLPGMDLYVRHKKRTGRPDQVLSHEQVMEDEESFKAAESVHFLPRSDMPSASFKPIDAGATLQRRPREY